MLSTLKPLLIALKGKGPIALVKRLLSIGKRYGLTAAKMDRSLEQLSLVLQEFDCHATLPITAVALARNAAVIQKHQAQGIEFAVHGYRHIDYSQLALEKQSEHFRKASQIFSSQGIHFEGFRCPYLRWDRHTLAALSQTRFTYDSSNSIAWAVAEKHTTDSYHRALNFYGAQYLADFPALPSLDFANNLVRIPYCLPDDEALVERLRWDSPNEMNQVWPAMFRHIHERGELFTVGLHPERTKDCSNALIATLQEVQAVKPTVWCARLSEIAAWWQARYAATAEISSNQPDLYHLIVNGPEGVTLLLRALEIKTGHELWFDNYQRATNISPCTVRSDRRPFIGISPNAAPSLVNFLKQQGYIVEISSKPHLYSLYLDCKSFSHTEERSLIDQIEGASFPLVRLARWPMGARSALCITGDIDALTLWDYGLRFVGK